MRRVISHKRVAESEVSPKAINMQPAKSWDVVPTVYEEVAPKPLKENYDMVPYPAEVPIEAAQVVVNVVANGFSPDGQHGDVACFGNAVWNILGYGLGQWKPHVHEVAESASTEKVVVPRSLNKCNEELAEVLRPLTVAKGDGTQATAADWKKLPWDQIILLALAILKSLLTK